MGLRSMFKKAFKKDEATTPSSPTGDAPTRWEKAVVGMNSIVAQVSKIDPDGVDVVCFPGSGGEGGMEHDIYRNVKDTQGLEALVTAQQPQGFCKMGQAMDVVLTEAFARGFEQRPCSILVLTAGRPDDHEALSQTLAQAARKVNQASDLSITFVQVGDDPWAEKYLAHLDKDLKTQNANGEKIDLVDTIKDEDIKKAVKEMKSGKATGNTGIVAGAFAGAAMGVGGMYMVNQMNAKKRKDGWNGKWKATQDGVEIATLKVKDDKDGCLKIKGWPDGMVSYGNYAELDNGQGYNIQHCTPDDPEDIVIGTIEDEHTIAWDDGTRWEEVNESGGSMLGYAGAAITGAVVGGATGYLLEKKFFNKASKKVKSDYVIVLDRSSMMAIPDLGK